MTDDKSEPGWRQTSDDPDDYIFCKPGGEMIGRVYLHDTGGIIQGKWRWFYSNSQGVTESRREAMLAVELAYEASRGTA
jgi:hypothetical protein